MSISMPPNGNAFKNLSAEQSKGLQTIAAKSASKADTGIALQDFKPSPTFKDRVCKFLGDIASFFRNLGSTSTPKQPAPAALAPKPTISQIQIPTSDNPVPTEKPAAASLLNTLMSGMTTTMRSLTEISTKWSAKTDELLAKAGGDLSQKSLPELKALAKEIAAEKVHLDSKDALATADKNHFSTEDKTALKTHLENTKSRLNGLEQELQKATAQAITTLGNNITAPMTAVISSHRDIPSMRFSELKTLNKTITEAHKHCDAKALKALEVANGLSKTELATLSAKVDSVKDQARSLKSELATIAPQKALQELSESSLSALRKADIPTLQTDLKSMGCTAKTCLDVEKTTKGMIHMAQSVGSGAESLKIPVLPTRTEREASTGPLTPKFETFDGGSLYGELKPETRLAMGALYADGVLANNSESTAFLKQLGTHMRVLGAEDCATAVTTGNYDLMTQMDNYSLDIFGVTTQSFGKLNAELALNAAKTPEDKSKVQIKKSLHDTMQNLKSKVTLTGMDGKKTQIPTNALKFDAPTVRVLLSCAKESDQKEFKNLFGYAMILQHKLDTGAPMAAPVTPDCAKELLSVLGLSNPADVQDMVQKGFSSDAAIDKTMSFIATFSARLGAREDVQAVLFEMAASPMDDIDGFVGSLYRSATNDGGIALGDAVDQVKQFVERFSSQAAITDKSSPATATAPEQNILRANKRTFLQKLSDSPSTLRAKAFDAQKGIHSVSDRLDKIKSYNDKIANNQATIDHCQTALASIATTLTQIPDLPTGIEIQHVRHVVNADLARQEVTDITRSDIGHPSADMPLVSTDVLEKKLAFVTSPAKSMFTTQADYTFKQKDMTTVIRTETKDDKTVLVLCERQHGLDGKITESPVGYLDPTRDKAFIAAYAEKATASIAHSDSAKHSAIVREKLATPESREAATTKRALTKQKPLLEQDLRTALTQKSNREAKSETLFATGSTAFKSAQNAVRVAIAEYSREKLTGLTRTEMKSVMATLTTTISQDPEAMTAIQSKLTHFQGDDSPELGALMTAEIRAFKGEASFKEWQSGYRLSGTAKKELEKAEALQNTPEYKNKKSYDHAKSILQDMRGGDTVSLTFGTGIDINTGLVGRLATSAATGGIADLSLTVKTEKTDDISLIKTDKGYQVHLSAQALGSVGLDSIFGGIASIGISATGSADIGYLLDFNQVDDAAEFVGALVSGNLESVKDKACLGAASAIHTTSGKSLSLSASVGVKVAAPIPGLDATLSVGDVKLAISGAIATDHSENIHGQTETTTMSFFGKFSYSSDAVGDALSGGVSVVARAFKPSTATGLPGEVTEAAHDKASTAAEDKAREVGNFSGEASLRMASEVSVTTNPQGFTESYSITDTIACNVFNKTDLNGASIATMAIDKLLSGRGNGSNTFADKLADITGGNSDLQAAVMTLLSKATPGQEMAVSRELSRDKCFELNTLLSTAGKKPEQIKTDTAAAAAFVKDIRNYDITGISLLSTAREVNNSSDTLIDQAMDSIGTVKQTTIAKGQHRTLETVSFAK
jgi:hypothetical protein